MNSCSRNSIVITPIPDKETEISTDSKSLVVTSRKVLINGYITPNGKDSIIERGVVYGKGLNPTISDNKTIDGVGPGNFTSLVKELTPGLTFYFRTYAANKKGVVYGNQLTISTPTFDFDWIDDNGKLLLSKESEYIIVIPDIQIYTTEPTNHKYLEKMIDWIMKFNDSGFKVKAVLQVGDVTDLCTNQEWSTAQTIFAKLDNKIDYILSAGNHDYRTSTRVTQFSEYFNYKNNSAFYSSFETNKYENAYFRLNIHDQPFQIFSLEFAPRNNVIAWANNIAKSNSNRVSIVMTHAFLANVGYRYDFEKYKLTQIYSPYMYSFSSIEKVNDGEEIWNKLISPNNNIAYVFCGHNLEPNNDFYIISENYFGKPVLQIIYNKQQSKFGGEGLLKIIEFKKNHTTSTKSYSTLYDKWSDRINQVENFRF